MLKFTEMMKNRRLTHVLGENLPVSKEEVTALIKEVVRESSAAFNLQAQRVVFLFGDAHKKLRAIIEDALKPLTPVEASPNTQAKLRGFAAGAGTISLFEGTNIVKNLQDDFPLYVDSFPVWSEQATSLAQVNVWTALAQENIGANLQHYNPAIDEAVATEWSIPANWNLRTQMIIGSIEAPAGEKEYMEDSTRFREFN